MHRFKAVIQKTITLFMIIMLIGGFPLGVYAEGDGNGSSSEQTSEQKKPPTYVYNPATGTWDSDEWSWNPNTYETKPVVKQPASQSAQGANGSTAYSGPGSNNQNAQNTSLNSQTNAQNNLGVNNTINATATSGNAAVTQNNTAGSALSGDAQSIANIINMLQSATVMGEQGITTFQQDITGDVVGDLIINPELIFNLGSNSQNNSEANASVKSGVNVNTDAEVTNTVKLSATSGDASVDSNTEAGDATSGNAYVMANVVNVLNSVISANQSFLGLINIYGNLDGDILFPPETINKLLASNMPTSTVTINNTTGEVELNSTNNQNTTNTITLDAKSGSATVDGNNTAGSASSGEAKTKLTVLNLTGSEVIASNSILVFVNVLGTWVGMIMNAPEGSTAAALGGGVVENNVNAQAALNSTNDARINNDLELSAQSGNASVTNNTKAGGASSGSAYAAANVANINNSSLNLSNWFGVLFINVFGSWNGSFGIDTLAGTRQQPVAANSAVEAAVPEVFGFVENNTPNKVPLKQYILQTSDNDDEAKPTLVPVSSNSDAGGGPTNTPANTSVQSLAKATQDSSRQKTLLFTGVGVLMGLTLFGADKASGVTQRRKNKQEIFAGSDSAGVSSE